MFRLLILLTVALVLPAVAAAQTDLTETYTSYDGTLTFNYPAGWASWGYGSDYGYVANSQAAREVSKYNGQLTTGQVVISINVVEFATPAEVFTVEDIAETMRSSFDADVQSLAQSMYHLEGQVNLVTEPAFVSGLESAVEMTYLRTNAEIVEEVNEIDVVYGQTGMASIDVTAPNGETARYHELAIAIVASIRFTPSSSGGRVIAGAGPAAVAGSAGVLWRQERAWGSGPENFGGLGGLAVDSDDRIYVADSEFGVRVLDVNGSLLYTLVNSEITHLDDLAVAADGTLWLADSYRGKVYHIDQQGNLQFEFGEQGTQPGQFAELAPSRVELGVDGSLYLFNSRKQDYDISGSVAVFAQDGTFIREFPTDPNDEGVLFGYAQLAAAPDGTIYVGDMYTAGVSAFAPDGTLIQAGIGAGVLWGVEVLAVDERGSIYAAFTGALYKLDASGRLLKQIAIPQEVFVNGFGLMSDGSLVIDGSSLNTDSSLVVRLAAP